jgi:hypothetical protein
MDARAKLLFAAYFEYQKDIPEMQNITPHFLGISVELFDAALFKLTNEGYMHAGSTPLITAKGIETIEEEFNVRPFWSGRAKINTLGSHAQRSNNEDLLELVRQFKI